MSIQVVQPENDNSWTREIKVEVVRNCWTRDIYWRYGQGELQMDEILYDKKREKSKITLKF